MKATKTTDKVDSIIETIMFIGAIIFIVIALYQSRSKVLSIFAELKDLTYSVKVTNEPLEIVAMRKSDPIVLNHMEDDRPYEEQRKGRYLLYSQIIGKELDVDPYLILAVIEAESHYNPDICGNGAVGLMQLIPSCHKKAMEKYGYSREDLFDPYKNIQVGAEYLSSLTHKYDVEFALVCYNKGEGGAHSLGVRSTGYSQHVLNIYNKLTGGDI